MYKICLVEDEESLAKLVKTYLEKEGYQVTVFDSGNEVLTNQEKYHLYILDIMLKDDITGYDLIKEIRKKEKDIPVIFTSARDQDLDRIIGLELGSDDYITKPYSLKELVLRVSNVLRRTYKKEEENSYIYLNYAIDPTRRVVTEKKKEIKLTTLEFDLLILFIENKNKCFSRDDLLSAVWGEDYFGNDRAVDDLVRRLRRKMPKLNINTIYGYGYRLS